MSRQQSSTPDLEESPRRSGGNRKEKVWIVWHRYNAEMRARLDQLRRENSRSWWPRGSHNWSRHGKYATRGAAQMAAEKNGMMQHFEFCITHKDDEKP